MALSTTLFDKMWSSHVVAPFGNDRSVIYIDRHFLQETTCYEAFDRLRKEGRKVHAPHKTFAVIDHCVSTEIGRTDESFPPTTYWIRAMRRNCEEFGIDLYDIADARQGIVHVIAPELGVALPGTSLVCGDSHTATCGGLGAWAFGIGTSQVGQVLASQALLLSKPRTMRVRFDGALPPGVYAKDIILGLIGKYGTASGTGYAVEYAGPAIEALAIEGRMTVSNMSVEFGARGGFVRADDKTFDFLHGRPFAPKDAAWDAAVARWRTLRSDDDAMFDQELYLDCATLSPQVSWGTSPQDMMGVGDLVPDPLAVADPDRRRTMEKALSYMGLVPGQPIAGTPIDVAFIGSCTNGRLSDLEEAAKVVRGRRVPDGVRAVVVPGSTAVKREAEARGLRDVFVSAGFEWREAGCSMCVSGNGDKVPPGKRSISTTNRNFEGRQGPDSRTHISSPAMVAAAAIAGCIIDVRKAG
ncbi:3-isopropylmalate dehydratase large subunit [Blastomonas fulva]|uniref:3-isopropylmalate dehydratase large subunit n=1 Tax=Blastomonas fulva TaxID=1550728 RepID=UPI003F723376